MAEESGAFAAILQVGALVAGIAVPAFFYYRGNHASQVSGIVELIREMERKGIEYWSRSESDPESKCLAVEIKRLSKHIGFEIRKARFSKSKQLVLRKRLTAFRVSVTGGNFEQKDRESDLEKVAEISSLCLALIDALRK